MPETSYDCVMDAGFSSFGNPTISSSVFCFTAHTLHVIVPPSADCAPCIASDNFPRWSCRHLTKA